MEQWSISDSGSDSNNIWRIIPSHFSVTDPPGLPSGSAFRILTFRLQLFLQFSSPTHEILSSVHLLVVNRYFSSNVHWSWCGILSVLSITQQSITWHICHALIRLIVCAGLQVFGRMSSLLLWHILLCQRSQKFLVSIGMFILVSLQ